VKGRVARVDIVHGIKHRGLHDRRVARDDQRRGAADEFHPEQHLVPIGYLVRRCCGREGHWADDGNNDSCNECSRVFAWSSPRRRILDDVDLSDGGQRPPSIGASENAPLVSRPQGSYEGAALRCNTLCKAPIARADATQKKAMFAFGVETNDCAKLAFLNETPNLNDMSDPHRKEFITKPRLHDWQKAEVRKANDKTTKCEELNFCALSVIL
jgi:hypothetical protein